MVDDSGVSPKPVSSREWYDFVGELADVLPGIHLGGRQATQALLDLCRLDAESQVLDVGCGIGHAACQIVEQYGSQVQGIDLSEVMIAKARERERRRGLADKVDFRVADVSELPFESDSFDVVLFESVLTPLPGDKRQAMAEMVKVVRPGGRIAANESTVDPSAPPELLALFREHPAIYGYFMPQTLRDLFEDAGLQVIEMVEAEVGESASARQVLGLRGLLSFMIRVYPKILLKLLRDARFRKASRVDGEIMKRWKKYMGYTLIVGEKPG